MATAVAYVDNTNNVLLSGLMSDIENEFINDATVTLTVLDSTLAEVSGETWPLTMEYIAASNGNYLGTLTHTLDLVSGDSYTAVIDADGVSTAGERFGHWEFPFKAKTRTK